MNSDPNNNLDPLPLYEKDKRYLSNEEYAKIIALGYIYSQYIDDDYVRDNIKSEIAKLRSENKNNNIYKENEKIYNLKQKTTKITYNNYIEYSKSVIQQLHRRDSFMIKLGVLIFSSAHFGELGLALSTLMEICESVEQNRYINNKSLLITLGGIIADKSQNKYLITLFDCLSYNEDINGLLDENRETCVTSDGFTAQEDDSCLSLNLSYDLGKTVISYFFYFRNNKLIFVKGYNASGSTQGSFPGYEQQIKNQWLRDGYIARNL